MKDFASEASHEPPQTTLFHIPMQSFENRNPFHDIHHILKIQGLVAKHQPLL